MWEFSFPTSLLAPNIMRCINFANQVGVVVSCCVFICISLAPGEMMHFLCSLLIDDVHFILCELLANPLPIFLFESWGWSCPPPEGICICLCQLPGGAATWRAHLKIVSLRLLWTSWWCSGNLDLRPAWGPLVVRNSQGRALPSKPVRQTCPCLFLLYRGLLLIHLYTVGEGLCDSNFIQKSLLSFPPCGARRLYCLPLMPHAVLKSEAPGHQSSETWWNLTAVLQYSFHFFPLTISYPLAWSDIHFAIPFKKYFI